MICSPRFFSDASAIELGWEILGHNQTNSVWLDQLSREAERQTHRRLRFGATIQPLARPARVR
jgi:hypothetical protein